MSKLRNYPIFLDLSSDDASRALQTVIDNPVQLDGERLAECIATYSSAEGALEMLRMRQSARYFDFHCLQVVAARYAAENGDATAYKYLEAWKNDERNREVLPLIEQMEATDREYQEKLAELERQKAALQKQIEAIDARAEEIDEEMQRIAGKQLEDVREAAS